MIVIQNATPRSTSSVDDVTAMNADDIKDDVISSLPLTTPMRLDCAPLSNDVTSLGPINVDLEAIDDGDGGSVGGWLRTIVGRTAPGAYLLGKLDRFNQQRRETKRRKVTEKELRRLNRKIVS